MSLFKNWGFRITVLYVGFALLILGMVFVSSMSREDLVSTNYYDNEIAYEKRIQAIKRTKKLEQKPTWNISERAMTVVFPEPISQITGGTLTLYRASDADRDIVVPLKLDSLRSQAIDLQKALPGMWRAKLEWKSENNDYYLEDVIYIE
ncbi:FixH family protein [bacterium]|nr:FixH family protein [bacterium]